MSDNNTLDYYNLHTADFVNTTQNVDFHEIQELFLSFLPAKAKILDFGCGSGRDTKYFIDNGYEVDAMDGSKELCQSTLVFRYIICFSRILMPVIHMMGYERVHQFFI